MSIFFIFYLIIIIKKRTEEEREVLRRKEEVAARSYDKVLANAKMTTNKDQAFTSAQDYEENFF